MAWSPTSTRRRARFKRRSGSPPMVGPVRLDPALSRASVMAARRARRPVAAPPAPPAGRQVLRQALPHDGPSSTLAERSLRALILSAERIAATITDNTELTHTRPDLVAKALAALG